MINSYQDQQLIEGNEYQDFLVDALSIEIGLNIQLYSSKFYQYEVGESRTGIEIKFDKRFGGWDGSPPTENLFIECAERTERQRDAGHSYRPSGIYRPDSSWLYIVGDWDNIFIFANRDLQKWDEERGHQRIEVQRQTAEGFLLYGKKKEGKTEPWDLALKVVDTELTKQVMRHHIGREKILFKIFSNGNGKKV